MKGLIYKNYLVTRKYYFMAFIFFIITALFMILIRPKLISKARDVAVINFYFSNQFTYITSLKGKR